MSIRVLICDDHRLFREGLRALIRTDSRYEIVGEAGDGLEAVHLADTLLPEIIIMDVMLPKLNGPDAIRSIVQGRPGVRVLALSMYSDSQNVSRALESGAMGYLLKDCAFDEILRALELVMLKQSYLSPKIAGTVLERLRQKSEPAGMNEVELSTRERTVLQLIAEGKSSKEIATALHLSAKTVESHRGKLMAKLNLHSVAELTKYAIRLGLTTTDP